MPVIESAFQTEEWLRNGHVQTVLAALRRVPFGRHWSEETLEVADGDFLTLEWWRTGSSRLAVLGHGMEGSSRSAYIRGLGRVLAGAGWDVVAWNLRGCGVRSNRGPGWYHSGQTEDLRAVLARVFKEGYAAVALVGFSLGGNLLLKYLGEGGVNPVVRAAVAVSAPLDLEASAAALDGRWANRLYLWNFMRSFRARISEKRRSFPAWFQGRPLRPRSIAEFDAWYTAPSHGFSSAKAYWRSCSASAFLSDIRTPTLLLSARDDPFLTPESFPLRVADASQYLWLEAPPNGGHVAFLNVSDGLRPWWEERVRAFLDAAFRA